jgi:hypothetical protein
MLVLNVKTKKNLEEFFDKDIPNYAILSHALRSVSLFHMENTPYAASPSQLITSALKFIFWGGLDSG